MSEKYLSINKASKELGVSIQTLRNWDKCGYFKSVKTMGNHRRYLMEDIVNFMNGKRSDYNVISCFEIDHQKHLDKLANEVIDERARDCGGFSKSQVSLLLKNQDTVHNKESKDLFSLDLFYKLLSSFSAPYLFETRVMLHPNTLAWYERVRFSSYGEMKIVMETESIYASTYKEQTEYWENNKDFNSLMKIINNSDMNCVNDVMNNVRHDHKLKCNKNQIEEKIEESIKLIDERTGTKEPKFVLFPPEMIKNDNLIELTDTLSQIPGTNRFVSRLIENKKILVGMKTNNNFSGYLFCPYMICCKENDNVMMRLGKKLLRCGSECFAKIEVE